MILAHPDQARIYAESEMSDVEAHEIAGGAVAVFSASCPGRDAPNEDAAGLIPFAADAGVLVVADGLGGVAGGQRASELAVRMLRDGLTAAARDGVAMRTAILDAIEAANRSVCELGGAATTLAAVAIEDGSIRPYHVGDSMVLVFGQRGKVKLQTVSHSPVGFAVEAGVLDEAEAMHHADRHLVSNVLGASDMRIEVGAPLALSERDTLLLCSDGLLDNLHVGEVVDRARAGPMAAGMRRLLATSRQRMTQPGTGEPSKPDDLTIVTYRRLRGS